MSLIKNVTVIGGSGNLGVPLIKELLASGFNVTALIRESSTSTFPPHVTVKRADFDSVDSLTVALKGQDAVVSAMSFGVIGGQYPIVDAAIAAKVKRFIPSEFGANSRTIEKQGFGALLQQKVKALDYIIEKSNENTWFTWTGIATGLFFDWGLSLGVWGFNKVTKSVTIYDSGNQAFQTSNVGFISRAVAAVLSRPEQTANKYLEVGSFNITHNEVLRIITEVTGEKWNVEHVNSTELEKAGLASLEKGDTGNAFLPLLISHTFGDGNGHALKPEDSDNALLGLKEEDPRVAIEAWLST